MRKTRKTGLGRVAAMLERTLAHLPGSLPFFASDLVARGTGHLIALSSIQQSAGAENRVRGILSAPLLGATGLKVGRGVIFRGLENINFGNGVSIADRVFLSASGDRGRIEIGGNTHVDVGCVLYGQGGLLIGNDCAIASGVIIYTQTNQYHLRPLAKIVDQGTRYACVTIGTDIWIGAGVRILPGVTIEDHAVIGAGAVVTRDVQSWKVVAGCPARVINDRRGGPE